MRSVGRLHVRALRAASAGTPPFGALPPISHRRPPTPVCRSRALLPGATACSPSAPSAGEPDVEATAARRADRALRGPCASKTIACPASEAVAARAGSLATIGTGCAGSGPDIEQARHYGRQLTPGAKQITQIAAKQTRTQETQAGEQRQRAADCVRQQAGCRRRVLPL